MLHGKKYDKQRDCLSFLLTSELSTWTVLISQRFHTFDMVTTSKICSTISSIVNLLVLNANLSTK